MITQWASRVRSPAMVAAMATLATVFAAGSADAEVRKLGHWPEADETVSLDLSQTPRSEAVRELAEEAGWSVVLEGLPNDPVDLRVEDQPASKVLDLLLAEGVYVAQRDGTLVSIKRGDVAPGATTSSAHGSDGPPPAPTERGKDRAVSGGDIVVQKGEVFHDVAVMGGKADIYGTVTGDLVVTGGTAHVHEGGRVMGDAEVIGGSLNIDDGARVDGDANVLGGTLHRGEHAVVGGDTSEDRSPKTAEAARTFADVIGGIGGAITSMALLFALGAMLIALLPPRMESLRVEIASRPMRSLALGALGLFGSFVLMIALGITVIGIPFAIVGAFVLLFAILAGCCATLQTIGKAIAGHKTDNEYIHLAVGCVLSMVVGAIPYVGTMVDISVLLIGFGSVVATRGAGLVRRRNKGAHPYRSEP